MNLAQRAAADAAQTRAADAARAKVPDELQVTAALDLAVTLGLAEYGQGYGNAIPGVDPLTVELHGYSAPYDRVSVEVLGLRFEGNFLWGGRDWRYKLAGSWKATRRGRFGRRQTRAVGRIGDLDGWLDDAAPMHGKGRDDG